MTRSVLQAYGNMCLCMEYRHQFLPAATKLGQANVFTGVCDSVHRGGCLPQCMMGYHTPSQSRHPQRQTPPWEQTPPKGRHPPKQTPPWSRHPSALGADTPPRSRHPPGADNPQEQTPPWKQTPEYGQRAAGTHPTGMHSCFRCL